MTEKNNERTARRCPDCVTEIRRGGHPAYPAISYW